MTTSELLDIRPVDVALRLVDNITAHIENLGKHQSEQYAYRIHQFIGEFARFAKAAQVNKPVRKQAFLSGAEPLVDRSAVIAHGRNKPFGYAGDDQVFDWTYSQHADEVDAVGALLVELCHPQVAPRAVRDRKLRFERVLAEVACQVVHRPLRVLNFCSGPACETVDCAKAATHPTKNWIEWCGDWHLVHPTADQMRSLAAAAGLSKAEYYHLRRPVGRRRFPRRRSQCGARMTPTSMTPLDQPVQEDDEGDLKRTLGGIAHLISRELPRVCFVGRY